MAVNDFYYIFAYQTTLLKWLSSSCELKQHFESKYVTFDRGRGSHIFIENYLFSYLSFSFFVYLFIQITCTSVVLGLSNSKLVMTSWKWLSQLNIYCGYNIIMTSKRIQFRWRFYVAISSLLRQDFFWVLFNIMAGYNVQLSVNTLYY